MFKEARLKLTAAYLLIIMLVSLAFSVVIYRAGSFEIERFATAQRSRFDRRSEAGPYLPSILDQELIEETKLRILTTLAFINLGIFGIAGILGYYLSGKTLLPIQKMMDEQYRFVSDASHELKTPITAIKTTLEVALRDKSLRIADAKQTLRGSLEEANRLQKLAEGLLELTHKNTVGALIPAELAETISKAVKAIEPIAKEKNIAIKTKIPQLIVALNEESLERAIVTILDNAIKYNHKDGKIEVVVKSSERFVAIAIEDSGYGIEEEHIPYLFDRFYRADPARSELGYGLGLSIAKQIVSEHHGEINIESKIGKGTKVIIKLPYSAKLQKEQIN